ncbi:hypothetical protein PENTCL1PPCAC_15618, partial [Pristionchus entomophagus]
APLPPFRDFCKTVGALLVLSWMFFLPSTFVLTFYVILYEPSLYLTRIIITTKIHNMHLNMLCCIVNCYSALVFTNVLKFPAILFVKLKIRYMTMAVDSSTQAIISMLLYSMIFMSRDCGRNADEGPNSAANSTCLIRSSRDVNGFFASIAEVRLALNWYLGLSITSLIVSASFSSSCNSCLSKTRPRPFNCIISAL